jgi:RNA polymerase sigma-70 factor (ECF subfamily)
VQVSAHAERIERLVAELADPLFNFGYRMCGNREDAEDLVQETFFSAWRAWESFRGNSSPKTWLYSIASRACLRKRRRRSGEPKRFLSIEEVLPGPESPRLSPSDLADRSATRERVRRALLRIPAVYRTALVLKDIEGLSLGEIGAALRLKVPTVKTRIHRGRLALRKEILGEPYGGAPPAPAECLAALGRALEMLDRGETPSLSRLCARCRSVYRSLELGRQACSALAGESLDEAARSRLRRRLRQAVGARLATPQESNPGSRSGHGR